MTISKRFNLHAGNQPRDGFDNKDIRANPNDSYTLEWELPNSVDSIIVNPGCLESITKNLLKKHLEGWFQAMQPNGNLTIYYSDPFILANQLIYGKMPFQQFEQMMLHSKWVSLYDMNTLCQIVQSSGFKIRTTNYHESIGVISAYKPDPASISV